MGAPESLLPALDWYCGVCRKKVAIPHASAWPQECPHCKTPHPIWTTTIEVPNGGVVPSA